MLPRLLGNLLLASALGAGPGAAQQADPTNLINALWTSADQKQAVGAVLEAGLDFATVYHLVKAGPRYPAAEEGILELSRRAADGTVFRYTILVPAGYDPTRPYPVHVFLHGGVRRPAPQEGGQWWRDYDRMRDSSRISVFPAGWDGATWWERAQVENLAEISRELRRRFNVDENRFYLIGISDGGSGVYFHAFHASTIWAGFLPYIGHPAVLNNPRSATEGDLFVSNLSNRPFFVVNGEVDRLYPTVSVIPYVERFREAGVEVTFRPQAGGGHDMRWYPREAENVAAFIRDHPRDALPDRLSWETERTNRYQRHSWLLITGLGPVEGESDFPPVDIFPHRQPSGRVDLVRRGNTVHARTRGVRRFTLLLSPGEFDLSKPIIVMTNGVTAFEGMVEPDLATLLRWAARDRDRTALFAVELEIEVQANPS